MNKYVNAIVKGVVVASCMAAANEVIGFHASPYKSATLTRLLCNIAGGAIGFYVGDKVSTKAVERIEDILILSGLEEIDG